MKKLIALCLLVVMFSYGQDTTGLKNSGFIISREALSKYIVYSDTILSTRLNWDNIPIITFDSSQVVWDSLGYLKISKVTKIVFSRRWSFGYDSVWYIKNDQRFYNKKIMEFYK